MCCACAVHVLYMCIPFAIVHSSGRTGSIDHNDHLICITLQLCPEGERGGREGRGGEGGRKGGREKEGRRKKKSIHIHTKNNSNLYTMHMCKYLQSFPGVQQVQPTVHLLL